MKPASRSVTFSKGIRWAIACRLQGKLTNVNAALDASAAKAMLADAALRPVSEPLSCSAQTKHDDLNRRRRPDTQGALCVRLVQPAHMPWAPRGMAAQKGFRAWENG